MSGRLDVRAMLRPQEIKWINGCDDGHYDYPLTSQNCMGSKQKDPKELPRIVWEASKKIQKTHKNKILCSRWMQDMETWFGRWDATHLFHDA